MRALPILMAGVLLGCGAFAAADTVAPNNPDTIHVNAMRDPEVRKYAAIVAGLDAFDRYHALAPNVAALRFRVTPSRKEADDAAPLTVKLEGDDGFVLPLALDADHQVVVPRSEAALDANSEMTLNRKRHAYRIGPHVRTPGLAANVRRLGDLRLECKVTVAIAKEEIGTMLTLTINSLLLTRDWCSWFDGKHSRFSFRTPQPLVAAILQEGNRSAALEVDGRSFSVPLFNGTWGDDALIELESAPVTETAAETPRTAP